MKILPCLLTIAAAAVLQPHAAQAQGLQPQSGDYVVDFNLATAMFLGETKDGRSMSRIALEMEDRTVFINSIYAYGTSEGTGYYTIIMGDNTPRVLCRQTSREARLHAMDELKKPDTYAVRGRYDAYDGRKITLVECQFGKSR